MTQKKTLVIGFGNAYCHDDGAGFYIVNELRRRQRIRELQPDEDGLDELGGQFDTIVVHQLVPEIVPVVVNYQLILFVDAHLGSIPDEVRVVQVQEEDRFHAVTHQMSPGLIMSLARKAKGVGLSGYLVSVKGEDFDFGLGLSGSCRSHAQMAVEKILELAGESFSTLTDD